MNNYTQDENGFIEFNYENIKPEPQKNTTPEKQIKLEDMPEIEPPKKPEYKKLPIQNSNNKKSKKLFFFVFIMGLTLGMILISVLIHFGAINYISTEKCNEFNTLNYNNGAAFIINYTMTTGKIPYFENGELKELNCKDLEV